MSTFLAQVGSCSAVRLGYLHSNEISRKHHRLQRFTMLQDRQDSTNYPIGCNPPLSITNIDYTKRIPKSATSGEGVGLMDQSEKSLPIVAPCPSETTPGSQETLSPPAAEDVDQAIEEIASIDMNNQRLMEQIRQFTAVLKNTMQDVTLTAQTSRNEADRVRRMALWKASSQITAAALEQVVAESQEVKKAVGDWKEREARRLEERKLESLKCEEKRVKHSLEAAAARLAEATARLHAAEIREGRSVRGKENVINEVYLEGELDIPFSEVNSETVDSELEEASHNMNASVNTGEVLGPDTVSLPATLKCVIGHPGALSCTSTTIRKDEVKRTAVITMETTVRCAGDACLANGIEGDDYIALGLQAISDAATELRRSQYQCTTDSNPLIQEKHVSILKILEDGRMVSCTPMEPPSSFGHVSFVAKMRSPDTKREIRAMVKPRVEGDAEGWHRAPIEWVAYELNLMLGMDYVPPVFYRQNGVDLDWNHFDEAAFIYWVPSCRQLNSVPASNWGISVARLLSDTRILDVLLNNSDRHHGHFYFGEHWTDGNLRPVLIDHAAGFRKEAIVTMEHENAFETGPVRCIAASTYLKLRFLDADVVAEKFKKVLRKKEIEGLMDRRNEILQYFDNLVKERGYHRTVID